MSMKNEDYQASAEESMIKHFKASMQLYHERPNDIKTSLDRTDVRQMFKEESSGVRKGFPQNQPQ
jgi:hypothetical protein